jgi:hypothetical protein
MTFAQLTEATGATKGAIWQPLMDMVDDGLVVRVGTGRGATYSVADEHRTDLQVAVEQSPTPGQLIAGLELLDVIVPRATAFVRALAHADIAGAIAWAVETGAAGDRWLLAIHPEAGAAAPARVRALLEASGCSCRPARANRTLTGTALRRWAAAVRDAEARAD